MALAEHIAQWSKDPSSKVGAVIVNFDRTIAGIGYNGFPRGVSDDAERYLDKKTKYAMVVHAEVNAILSRRYGNHQKLYSTRFPCSGCAKLIIQSGILEVITKPDIPVHWTEDAKVSRLMMDEAGIYLRFIDD